MYRASTPKHVFCFDFDPEKYFEQIQISYAQDDEIILTKEKKDLLFETKESACGTVYTASLQLTQEETNLFGQRPFASVQIRFLDTHQNIITTPTVRIRIEQVLNDEVLK